MLAGKVDGVVKFNIVSRVYLFAILIFCIPVKNTPDIFRDVFRLPVRAIFEDHQTLIHTFGYSIVDISKTMLLVRHLIDFDNPWFFKRLKIVWLDLAILAKYYKISNTVCHR